MKKQKVLKSSQKEKNRYSDFSRINGFHPLKDQVDDAYIEYPVRKRENGTVSFFNFSLAKEMGLIDKKHTDKLTKPLTEAIMDCFSIVIINEFDELHKKKFKKESIKKNKYMATRYLQIQHVCKRGTTSGDGRSIWNGYFEKGGKGWDISSCGTGATALSPATSKTGKFFETGDPTISYGCGYFEKDEGLEGVIFSEVMAQNGVPTERILALIEYPGGMAISIRAHQNLLRPSHFFNHLKQGNVDALKRMVDFYISRQIKNKLWESIEGRGKYDKFLEKMSDVFSETAARFEDEYIFCWLDWDGDNILMDGSIIDYGSVRQFGLFHHEYRFDDDDRYSTKILEQRIKSRYIVQCFIQIIDFIKTGHKKNINEHKHNKVLERFDDQFKYFKNRNLLVKMGFNDQQVQYLLKKKKNNVEDFRKQFSYFEKSKSKKGRYTVSDGITWDAVFCMRDILRELPQIYLTGQKIISKEYFIDIIKSSYTSKADLEIGNYRGRKIDLFQRSYNFLVEAITNEFKVKREKVLLEINMRSSVINKYDRVTGDSITVIADKVSKFKPKLKAQEFYALSKNFALFCDHNPLKNRKIETNDKLQKNRIKALLKIVREYSEGL